MNNLIKSTLGIVILGLALVACSGSVEPIPPINHDQGDIYPKVDLATITSEHVFDNYSYPIEIYLPKSYESNQNLPVIYVLDGQINRAYVQKHLDPSVEAIVVGIGNFAINQEWPRRWIDFAPEDTPCGAGTGRASEFYNFLTKEVVPYIDNNYNSDLQSRVLVGHSAAALFVAVSMFWESPDNFIFHNFIAADPVPECAHLFFRDAMESDYDFPSGDGKFKLYISLSGENNPDPVRQLADGLQSKNYPWLTFRYDEFLDHDHMGVLDPSYESALGFVFE